MNHTRTLALVLAFAIAAFACEKEKKAPTSEQEPSPPKPAPATPANNQETPAVDASKKSPTQTSEDAAVAAVKAQIEAAKVDKSKSGWKSSLKAPTKVTFTKDKSYFWNLSTTKGDIKVKLMPDVAPMHVTSTMYLTMLGFYDDIGFHRVIPGFMAQGGDPIGNGTGGPGYKYAGEFSPSARHNRPGILSMANAGPNTDGSQFFLTFVATGYLDDKHTVFGEVTAGMDTTMKALEAAGSRTGATSEKLVIKTATITVE